MEQSFESPRPRYPDLEDVILVTGDRMAGLDRFEVSEPLRGVIAGRRIDRLDRNESGQREANLLGGDAGGVGLDDPALLQPAHPLMDGGNRKTGSPSEIGEADATVVAEQSHDLTVQLLEHVSVLRDKSDRGRSS